MRSSSLHSLFRNLPGLFLGASLSIACTAPERSFNDTPTEVGGATAAGTSSTSPSTNVVGGSSGIGGTHAGGMSASTGGSSGGNGGSGGNSGTGGATGNGGTSATTAGGTSSVGSSAIGGAPGGRSSTGGSASTIGGSTVIGGSGIGGTSAATGGNKPTGGTTSTNPASATGGTPPATGGVPSTGGAPATGGSTIGTGGTTGCVVKENPEVSCTDGVDNDCDGLVDCPVVGSRFPEPGRAAAGDDLWVSLNAPPSSTNLKVQRVECRFGRPGTIGAVAWGACVADTTNFLKVYAMSGVQAKNAANDGVTQFDFRFNYTTGAYSEISSIVFYEHSSLYDGTDMVSKYACPPPVPDEAFFQAVAQYLVTSASQATFAPADVQLKNPFIMLQFTPQILPAGNSEAFVPTTAVQKVTISSLRHRFVLDAARQMLLVSRTYQSLREAPSCRAATIRVWDKHTNGIINTPKIKRDACDAVVLNKAGAGLCLQVVAGTPKIADPASSYRSMIFAALGWPKAEATMWLKLFDDIPARAAHYFFSDKCVTGDTLCLQRHPGAPVLPDSGNPFFNTP